MNYLDIVIVIPLLYGFLKGFTNGFIKEITSFLGFFIGVYAAINFSSLLNPKFLDFAEGYDSFIPIISFVVLFVVTVLIIKIAGYILEKITNKLSLGFLSRLMGSIFGFLKILIFLLFLLSISLDYSLIEKKTIESTVLLKKLKEKSLLINPEIKKHKSIIIDKVEKRTKKIKEKIQEYPNYQ